MSEKFKAFINNFSKFFQGNKKFRISSLFSVLSQSLRRGLRRESETNDTSRRSPYRRLRRGEKFDKKFFLMAAVVVLLIAVSVSIPVHQAHANVFGWALEGFWKGLSAGGELLINFIYAVLFAILNIFLMLSIILVKFGAWCIDAALDPRLYVGDATNPGVLTSSTVNIGWTTVRDTCNTFYMFFLLIIAFGTILRSSTFNAKNLLPKLIISLFLINFSAVIAKLVIDFGQVFLYEIMSWMGNFKDGGGSLTSIVDKFNNEINGAEWQASLDQVLRVAFALVYSLVLGFVYIMLALFLLIRLVAFIFLIILSPIAFLSIVLPSMSKYTSRWWSELIKYSLFGPIFMFFVYLSATMANELVGNFVPLDVTNSGFDAIKDIVVMMFQNAIPLLMLLAVVPVTQELGMGGANKIMGGAAGIGKIAMGTYAGVKLAGGLGKRAGGGITSRFDTLSKGVDWAKQGYYNKMGKLPGMKGTALRGKAGIEKKREDRIKKMEMDFGDLKSIDLNLLEAKANSPLGTTDDKAFLLKAATAQGKLGDPKYDKYLQGAETSLSKKDLGELTDKNLSMHLQTKEGQKDVKAYEGKTNSATGVNYTTAEAEEQAMKGKMADIIKDGKAHEVQGLDNAMAAKVWHQSQDSEQRKSSINRMAKDQRAELSNGYIGNTIGAEFDSSSPTFVADVASAYAAASDEDKEKDLEYRANSVKLGKDVEESFKRGGVFIEKDIEKAFEKFSAKDIAKMDKKVIEKHGHAANNSQVRALNRSGETEAVKAVRTSKVNNLNKGIKMGSIGGAKTPVNYDKAKKDLVKAKESLDWEIKVGGDPARIKKLKTTISNIENNIKPLLEVEKDIDYIDNNLSGKTY